MSIEYTREEMINSLVAYFRSQQYEVEEYSGRLGNIRLPLDCIKWGDGKKQGKPEEEIVIDIITEQKITKENYLPELQVEGLHIKNASSVRFFQYYLPSAKVFWAYGHYVDKNEDFEEFRDACVDNGIGLLEITDKEVNEVLTPLSLNETIGGLISDTVNQMQISKSKGNTLIEKLSGQIADHQDEYIQYLVYYAEPHFRRREITGRRKEDLSMLLVNKLENLNKISYAQPLREFALSYRHRIENDHEIALEIIRSLWETQFQVKYPDLLRDFEVVLLLDPRYRDHFLHQFQVFLLGALIIDELYDANWVHDFESNYGSKLDDAWLAASTYHDFNYPVQNWGDWMKRFLEENFHRTSSVVTQHLKNPESQREIFQLNLEKVVVRDEFLAKMRRLLTAIGCPWDDGILRFILTRVAINKNHAVIGALTFFEKFQSSSSLTDLAIDQAASSILLHDEANWQCFCGKSSVLPNNNGGNQLCTEEEELCQRSLIAQLKLEEMPLQFLLAFCDYAQEWGRKGKGYDVANADLSEIIIDPNKHEVSVGIVVEDDASLNRPKSDLGKLKQFLKGDKFVIRIESRTGIKYEFRMTGT